MPQIERIISRGQLVPLIFTEVDLAASQTDVQMKIVDATASTVNDEYLMPFDGEIVAVSIRTTAAASAGTLTAGASIDGTEDADTTVSVTTEQSKYVRVARDKAAFAANKRIGCEITTDGSWNATTADAVVVVWVLLYLDGI